MKRKEAATFITETLFGLGIDFEVTEWWLRYHADKGDIPTTPVKLRPLAKQQVTYNFTVNDCKKIVDLIVKDLEQLEVDDNRQQHGIERIQQ